jgi:hypothetical protein
MLLHCLGWRVLLQQAFADETSKSFTNHDWPDLPIGLEEGNEPTTSKVGSYRGRDLACSDGLGHPVELG